MKILTSFLFTLLCSAALLAQPTSCDQGGTTAEITYEPFVCGDDYILFTFTVERGNNGNSLDLVQLPPNTVVNITGPNGNGPNGEMPCCGSLNRDLSANSTNIFQLNMPSPGCAPLNIGFDFCYSDNFVYALIGPDNAPIPTLGQWALITLGLLCMVFGILKIRSKMYSYS